MNRLTSGDQTAAAVSRRLVAVAAGCWLAVSACTTFSPAPSPSPEPTASAAPGLLDLEGTAWRTVSIVGQTVPEPFTPRLEFEIRAASGGLGFSGCEEFLFRAAIALGRLAVEGVELLGTRCQGPAGDVENRFLAAFEDTETWSVEGDGLFLEGPQGVIVLTRDLPPLGDASRLLADMLHGQEWSVVRVTGANELGDLPSVRFSDKRFVAIGECGFSGKVQFGTGGAVTFTNVGWDLAGCFDVANDPRPALERVLEGVMSGRPTGDGAIVLTGPSGEVELET
jgi:heat shock protein HslJ